MPHTFPPPPAGNRGNYNFKCFTLGTKRVISFRSKFHFRIRYSENSRGSDVNTAPIAIYLFIVPKVNRLLIIFLLGCSDKISYCKHYESECENAAMASSLKHYCRKTCGFCQGNGDCTVTTLHITCHQTCEM